MKKLISLVLSLLLVFSMTAVYAAPTADDITYTVRLSTDDDGTIIQTVVINGSGADAGEFVTLRIWKDGMSEADYDEDPSARVDDIDLFAVLLQTVADENGEFEFEFLFDEEAADYRADIKSAGDTAVQKTISTADVEAANDFLEMINDAAQLAVMDTDDFAPVLDAPSDYGLVLTTFNRLTPANQEAVLEAAIDLFIANNDDDIENTIETVTTVIGENTLLAIFDQTADADILAEAFGIYADIVDIENLENAAGIDDLFDGFEDEQDEVFAAMGNKEYTDVADLLEAFKERVFLKAIKDTQYYNELAPIIEGNLDYLELDEDALEEYEDSSAVRTFVLKALNKSKSNINTVAKFELTFKNAVDDYGKDDSRGSTGGGSSTNVTVSSDLIPNDIVKPTAGVYSDMSGHWAYPAVSYLSNTRIVSGRGDGTFDPDAPITRAEFVKMIVEAYGLYDSRATADFVDVSTTDWYYGYVASMVKRGYILGNDMGQFNPNAIISRQDMAVILYRTLQGKNLVKVIPTLEKLFTDFDTVSPYAQNSVTYLSNMGLINGSDGMYRPHDSSTRAEAAQVLFNAIMEVGVR